MESSQESIWDIESLYKSFREEFVRLTNHYPLPEEDRIDIYQDAIIAYYESVTEKKLEINKTPKAYIFGTGKLMIFNKLKQLKKTREKQANLLALKNEEQTIEFEEITINPLQQIIKEKLNELGDKCRQILTLYYIKNYNIEAIKHEMNLKNENVTKSQKSRCLKQLKTMVLNT